ncbi:MAG: radical SAM protein [Parcubacteria group bacterium]
MEKVLRNKILYRSGPGPADFCVNYIEGCFHGCRFPCYGMLMEKMRGKIKNYSDWIRPKLVANALELLNKELPKFKNKIKSVHLCYSTDPFMQKQSEISKMTLEIIERLNRENVKCVVLTKGILPACLADIKKYGKNNEYGITLVSLDKKFKKQFEPHAASYVRRIKALKFLHDKGLKTWVSMEPYPTPNLAKQNLTEILKKIKFADKIIFGRLNYNIKSAQFIGNGDFYQKNADLVKKFCIKNKIQCHIKYGTSQKNDKEMRKIFGGEKRIKKLAGVLAVPI